MNARFSASILNQTPMTEYDSQLIELKHAYQTLAVPTDATTASIKHAYRRLVKRWHPDLCASGTPEHVEATHMARLINKAYASIAHAPLRYHVDGNSIQTNEKNSGQPNSATSERIRKTPERIPKTDRIEFWVRFVCGAVFGVFVILEIFVSVMPDSLQPSGMVAFGAVGLIVGCGFAAARYGDKFWYSILRRWWLWS
jgi:preprotein translocase subunit Sec63